MEKRAEKNGPREGGEPKVDDELQTIKLFSLLECEKIWVWASVMVGCRSISILFKPITDFYMKIEIWKIYSNLN